MAEFFRRLSLLFAAGSLGGLVSAAVAWFLGAIGLVEALDVKYDPASSWLFCQRSLLGGLWGLLFLIPIFPQRRLLQGLVLSVVPTLFQMVLYPWTANPGWLGQEPYAATLIVVLVVNAIWGIVAAAWLGFILEDYTPTKKKQPPRQTLRYRGRTILD